MDVGSSSGIRNIEFALESADLEMAALFQFSTVYAFSRICGSILAAASFLHDNSRESQEQNQHREKNAREYSKTLQLAGFLCVWGFVTVGIVRCLLNVAFAFAQVRLATGTMPSTNTTMPSSTYQDMVQKLEWQKLVTDLHDSFSESINVAFAALTLLCVMNMVIICRMQMIEEKLGNANLKFTGTRLLILALEIQGKLMDAFTVDSKLYNTAEKYRSLLPDWVPFKKWSFSTEQAHLFNLSLLNIECFLVVVLNYWTWHSLNLKDSGIMRFRKVWNEKEEELEANESAVPSHRFQSIVNRIDNSDDDSDDLARSWTWNFWRLRNRWRSRADDSDDDSDQSDQSDET